MATKSSSGEELHWVIDLYGAPPRSRLQFLKALNDKIAAEDFENSTAVNIMKGILQTYAFPHDRPSQFAVQRCFESFYGSSVTKGTYLKTLVEFLDWESKKRGLAPTSMLVLLNWTLLAIQQATRESDDFGKYSGDLIDVFCNLSESSAASEKQRSSGFSKSGKIARKGLVKIFTHSKGTPANTIADAFLERVLSAPANASQRRVVALGVVCNAASSNKATKPCVVNAKTRIHAFYAREVLGSKASVPAYICQSMAQFFAEFTTVEDFETELLPTIEKSLLRSPEVVLDGLLKWFILSTNSELDISKLLKDRLLKNVMSCIKSTNPNIRSGSILTFEALMQRCRSKDHTKDVAKAILEAVKAAKTASADQRVAYMSMLATLPKSTDLALLIPPELAQLLSKEQSEAVINAGASALLDHYCFGLHESVPYTDNSSLLKIIVNGVSEKRASVKKNWICKVGEKVLEVDSENISAPFKAFCEAVAPRLASAFTEVASNPLQALQGGTTTTAYVATVLNMRKFSHWSISGSLRTADVLKQALVVEPKPSYLLSHKIYSKLTTEDDQMWALRALSAMSGGLSLDSPCSVPWGLAFLYFCSSATVYTKVRKVACQEISALYLERPKETGDIILKSVWDWLYQLEDNKKDGIAGIAKSEAISLDLAIKSMIAKGHGLKGNKDDDSKSFFSVQLVSIALMSYHWLLRGKLDWITICQNANVDPGALVSQHAAMFLERIEELSDHRNTEAIRNTAISAAAMLAFIAPEAITPLLVDIFRKDLAADKLRPITTLDVEIWKADPAVPWVNVLEDKTATTTTRRTKESDTLKWEAEVRAQLAAKKGRPERKLTPEEQAKVAAQLAKEASIRSNLEEIAGKVARGVRLIKSLADGVTYHAELWIGAAITSLKDAMQTGAGKLIGSEAAHAFLACSKQISPRLGAVKEFLGVAILRASDISDLWPEILQEDLQELMSRVLYRIRFVAEQRPLDAVTLLYTVPLSLLILEKRGIGTTSQEVIDEQIILAIEILQLHADVFQDSVLPKSKIFKSLIQCMRKYTQHYKLIKDCLLDICRSSSSSLTREEVAIVISGSVVPEQNIRVACLQALETDVDLSDWGYSDEIWAACHDDVEEVSELAKTIWELNSLSLPARASFRMLPFLESIDRQLRCAAARAMAEAITGASSDLDELLDSLSSLYSEKSKPPAPIQDEFGILKRVEQKDYWEARSGVALAYKELAPHLKSTKIVSFLSGLINNGCFGDKNSSVRDEMLNAATTVVKIHGKAHIEKLMDVFEKVLKKEDQKNQAQDLTNEAVILLYGALAQHLNPGDRRIAGVIDRLLLTLSTPSEDVQYAVACCLPPLIQASRADASKYVAKMLDQLFDSGAFATRRGAAYGLAGVTLGYGVSGLKEFRVMTTLKVATENKKEQKARQGALFAYELLSLLLGSLFEPYVIQILPQLLAAYGDSTVDVREACADTSRICFSNLSAYGVKVVLPSLLEGLDEPAWRSKKGACEMLGSMAYLAPNQLAINLPTIIPPLTNVLTDTHKEVRAAANRSLLKFGEVISNPEIKELVGVLLKALSDPTKYTDEALEALMKVSFVHYLDAPSLALVVKILERGLSDRSATKRNASQIIGSLAHLTERKDLMAHLPIIITGLKRAIVDPVPSTRATASKALGSLVEKLGEDALPDLIPGLMSTLKSETGAGDRLGSAQALSEVLAGLGTDRLEETLPTILQNAGSSKSTIREGFMSLFIFLPACFGNSFSPYLSKIIPPILAGLADEIDSIRETALRAGRLLVKNFATRAIDLLLPELERGLADDAYRIRLSSVELVGDLLFNLTGVTATADEPEEEASGEVSQSLVEILGIEKRDRILSALYICRCDTSGLVRNAAIGVWKALVSSPRTIKELVPTLTQFIIRRLASANPEQKVIAGHALGELIRKAGDGVLSILLPSLEEGLKTATDVDAKQGICIALKELIASTPPESLEDFEETLVSVVRTALVETDPEVRETAAEAFDSLQRSIGKRASDQVLPYLLNLLRSKQDAGNALDALLTLLTDSTRSNSILPTLIPTLLAPPISAFNARALANLVRVAGAAINRRLPPIINALMDNLIMSGEEDSKADISASLDAVLLSVDEFDGLNVAVNEMLSLLKDDNHLKRATMAKHMAVFFEKSELDYSRYVPDCIRILLGGFEDSDPSVVQVSFEALNQLTKNLKKEEMENLVVSTRQCVQNVGSKGHDLPGFRLPKGINAVLPIFLQGLMYGTPEQRTQAALGIADIVDRTNAENLKAFVTQITGPLIRVVSEKSVEVKAAILLTLNVLLEKIPMYLKPFLPQLQRTFAKSLAETSSELLRTRAAKALGTLITLTARVDPLVAELVSGARLPDTGVQVAMLKALYEVVSKAGGGMSEASTSSIFKLLDEEGEVNEDSILINRARLFGALIKIAPSAESVVSQLKTNVFAEALSKASVLCLNAVLLECQDRMLGSFKSETLHALTSGLQHKDAFMSDNCVKATGKVLLSEAARNDPEVIKVLMEELTTAIKGPNSSSTDTKRLSLVVVRTLGRLHHEIIEPYIPLLAPAVFSCVRDMVIPVKLSAEQAFLSLFQIVSRDDELFTKYSQSLDAQQKRPMQDYYKRIATKMAAAERERNDSGAAVIGLKSDEEEDMMEILSVGSVDLGGWVTND